MAIRQVYRAAVVIQDLTESADPSRPTVSTRVIRCEHSHVRWPSAARCAQNIAKHHMVNTTYTEDRVRKVGHAHVYSGIEVRVGKDDWMDLVAYLKYGGAIDRP